MPTSVSESIVYRSRLLGPMLCMHIANHVSMTLMLRSYRLFWLPLHTVTPTCTLTMLYCFADSVLTEADIPSIDQQQCAVSSWIVGGRDHLVFQTWLS